MFNCNSKTGPMMKRLNTFFLLMMAALTMASCNILDLTPDGRETLADIFADNDKTAAYLNSCYGNIHPKGANYNWVCNAPTALCDEGWLSYGVVTTVPSELYEGAATATAHPFTQDYDYYSKYLLQIRLCTTFLQNIGTAKVHSEADRSRWTAEAHVMKAYFMHEMIKWFGAFGYEPNGFPADYDYKKLVKPTVWQLAEAVAAECDAAIACPELPWRIDNEDECLRATKALAWCIKSKTYLFAASPLHKGSATDEEVKARWNKAYLENKAAVEALEANGYALKTTVADASVYTGDAAAYRELFASSTLTSATDKETIWHAKNPQAYYYHNYIGSRVNLRNAYRCGICPTQEMVDAYEVLNAAGTQAEPLLNLSNPYTNAKAPRYNNAALALGYDEDDPYAARRDPRMAATIIKNGDQIEWDGVKVTVETYEGGDNGINFDPNTINFTRTGYYFCKWVAPNADVNNNRPSAPWKYFRLGEIKLNYAEAAAEANHLDEAKAQVDAIRARVHMPALPDGLSQASMRQRIQNERMVELAYEECRYFDLRRWVDPSLLSSVRGFQLRCKNLTAMHITKTGTDYDYSREPGGDLVNLSTNSKDLLLPIPQAEAEILYSLTGVKWQNAGW